MELWNSLKDSCQSKGDFLFERTQHVIKDNTGRFFQLHTKKNVPSQLRFLQILRTGAIGYDV